MDIRGFFGGGSGKKEPKRLIESPAKKKKESDLDFDLCDSDDEGKKLENSRRRLQKKADAKKRLITAESSEADIINISSPSQSPARSKKQRTEASPPVVAAVTVDLTETKPRVQLKKLDQSAANRPSVKKELKGGVAGFFGEEAIPPQIPTTPQKTPVKAKAQIVGTPKSAERSPATRSMKRAEGTLDITEASAGKADYFAGLKFAVTGVMSVIGREAIESMVLEHGGKLVNSVSGKTNYVIAGALLEDGRNVSEGSKYRTAIEKEVSVLSENDFIAMIEKRHQQLEKEKSLSSPPTEQTARSAPNPKATVKSEGQCAAEPVSRKMMGMSSFPLKATPANASNEDMLWVDKYKPSNLSDVIGSNETVNKLTTWLRRWGDMHIHKTYKPPFMKENPGAKAALLSGPPGIGKTTVATIVAHALGYQVLEMNASDARSKRSIQEELTDVVLSRSIGASGAVTGQKRLVIMDEVDGMGGSDRGGIQELIKVIKSSKTPIICICNDRQSTKIRSLANSCYDLRVKRPTKTQIANRLIAIARAEGLNVEQNAAEMLVEQTGNDIRQVVNAMQMWRAQSNSMTYLDIKNNSQRIEKDKMLRNSPFDACGMILGGSQSHSLDDRYNSFFIDYSLVPLLVQQNYIDSAKNGIFKSNLSDVAKIERLSETADAMCDMDLIGAAVMGADQHWELLPAQAAAAVNAGARVRGFQSYPTFPQWLGKYSSTGKCRRLTQELVLHTALTISQGFTPMRLEYVPFLRQQLLQPLLKQGSDGAEEVIRILDTYGLSKDDFMETMKDLQFIVEKDPNFCDFFERLDSKVKANLTRLYNATEHRSQALVDQQAGAKNRGGGAGPKLSNGGNELVAEDDDDELLEDDGEDDTGTANIAAFMKKAGGKRKAPAGDKPAASKKTKKK